MTTVVRPASADRNHLGGPVHPVGGKRGRQVGLVGLPPSRTQFGVVDHAGEHDGDRDIEHGDDCQRGQNAAGHVALGFSAPLTPWIYVQ